jgi:hypothetical protein
MDVWKKASVVAAVAALMLAFLTLLTALLGPGAWAHDHEELGTAGAFYERWMRPPGRYSSCCNKQDCYATTIRRKGEDYEFVERESGQWRFLPASLLEQNQEDAIDSPDGLSHVCARPGQLPFCAVRGSLQ